MIMKRVVFSLGIFLLLAASISAQRVEAKAAPFILKVEAPNAKPLELAAADLAKLPRKEVRGKDHDGKESVYSGVELREILKLAGVKFGKDLRGTAIAQFLVVEAADNYKAVFSLTELDPEFTEDVIILADLQDGKPLSEKDGKYQVIVPKEKRHARWVRQVTALKVRSL